mmetsp:Transcript_27662/g.69690  ORF Transcript_27662/g.69690 Transcript_27662/m.69690 type:complete len:216 (+) Transcript_27662:1384-2031(+)
MEHRRLAGSSLTQAREDTARAHKPLTASQADFSNPTRLSRRSGRRGVRARGGMRRGATGAGPVESHPRALARAGPRARARTGRGRTSPCSCTRIPEHVTRSRSQYQTGGGWTRTIFSTILSSTISSSTCSLRASFRMGRCPGAIATCSPRSSGKSSRSHREGVRHSLSACASGRDESKYFKRTLCWFRSRRTCTGHSPSSASHTEVASASPKHLR